MTLPRATDPLVDAVLKLLEGGVNAELKAQLGEEPIVSTLPHPLPRSSERMPETQRPALFAWRAQETQEAAGLLVIEGPSRERVRLRLVYEDSAGQASEMAERWPLLRLVAKNIKKLLDAGHHAAVEGDAAILCDAGLEEVIAGSWRADYSESPDGETWRPRVTMQIDVVWAEVEPDDAVQPWSMLTEVSHVDASEEVQPQAGDLLSGA